MVQSESEVTRLRETGANSQLVHTRRHAVKTTEREITQYLKDPALAASVEMLAGPSLRVYALRLKVGVLVSPKEDLIYTARDSEAT